MTSLARISDALGVALALVAAASATWRILQWEAGVAQYAADGAPAFVYPLITAAQAAVAVFAPFRATRATAAAFAALIPAALVSRRALSGALRPEDVQVIAVIALAAATLASAILARKGRQR